MGRHWPDLHSWTGPNPKPPLTSVGDHAQVFVGLGLLVLAAAFFLCVFGFSALGQRLKRLKHPRMASAELGKWKPGTVHGGVTRNPVICSPSSLGAHERKGLDRTDKVKVKHVRKLPGGTEDFSRWACPLQSSTCCP